MSLALKAAAVAETSEPRLIAFLADDITRETVNRLVAQLGWRNAMIRQGGIAAAAQTIDAAAPPALLLIDISDNEDPLSAMDALAEICPPATRVVTVGTSNDIMLYRRLLAMGVVDYLHKPIAPEALYEALLQASRPVERAAPAAATKEARVIALVGARGGVGTTTLAAGIGWCLSEEHQQRVALLDLDLQFGNLALGLDLEPGRGLREALEHPERIDSLFLSGAMSSAGERLRILSAEEALDDHPLLDPSAVDPLLTALNDDFDCVIVDLPRALDGMARRLLARAETTAIVTDLSLAAMRDTHRLINLMAVLRPGATPLLLANRVGMLSRGEIARAEFEKSIGLKIDYVIPYDAKAASAMAEHGKALPAAARSSKAAAELRRLAATLSGGAVQPPRSLLKRWLKQA
jgi:pilus assembly protein CpaE